MTNCNKFQHPRCPQEWNLEWEFLSKLPKLSNCMLCMVHVIRYMRADTCDQIHVGHHIVSTWQKCSRLYQDSSTYLLCFYLLWTKQWCHRPSQLLLPVLWVLQVPCNVCAFGVSQMDCLCSIGYVGVMDFIWLWQPYLFNAFRFFNNAEAAKAFNLLCVRLLEDRHHCHWPSPAGRFYHPHHRLNSGHGGTIGKYGCYLLSV